MSNFQIWQGNYADILKILPGCHFQRFGFMALVMSSDPRQMPFEALVEKLDYNMFGFIKYDDKFFCYDRSNRVYDDCGFYCIHESLSDYLAKGFPDHSCYLWFSDGFYYYNHQQSKLVLVTHDETKLEALYHSFSTGRRSRTLSPDDLDIIYGIVGRAPEHVVNCYAKLKEVPRDGLDAFFDGLTPEASRTFTEDKDLKWFNSSYYIPLLGGGQGRLQLSTDMKEQIEKDLHRQSYISLSKTVDELKGLIRESSLYRSYSQRDATAGRSKEYIGSLMMQLTLSPQGERHLSDMAQIDLGTFSIDDKGGPCGISIVCLVDNRDTSIERELRKKIYCLTIIKDVLNEKPEQRPVTFITYREDIPNIKQEPLPGALTCNRKTVLTRMREALDSEFLYSLFSQPLINKGQFLRSLDDLNNRLPVNRNFDDRDVRKKAFEDLLVAMKEDIGTIPTSETLKLLRYKTDVNFFEEKQFGQTLNRLRLQYPRLESNVIDVWLQVKRNDDDYKIYQKKSEEIASPLLNRLLSIMAKSEWLMFQYKDDNEQLTWLTKQYLDALRLINEFTLNDEVALLTDIKKMEQALAEEDPLSKDIEIVLSPRSSPDNCLGGMTALAKFLSCIQEVEGSPLLNSELVVPARALHTAVTQAIKKEKKHWGAEDWRTLVQMLGHCTAALKNPTNFKHEEAIVKSATALLKRDDRTKIVLSALSLAGVLFWTGIAITLTLPMAAPVYFICAPVFWCLAVVSMAFYTRHKQQALVKPAVDYVQHVKNLGVFAMNKPLSGAGDKPPEKPLKKNR